MKILVPVKRVMDPNVPVRIAANGLDVVRENLPHTMNPFDEIALTEAVRLKRDFPEHVEEIITLSIGPLNVEETLRTALAIGADRAIRVLNDQFLEPLAIAKILNILTQEIKPDLVLLGKQSVDGDNGQVGPMLAGLRDWGQACNATKIQIDPRQVPNDCLIASSRRSLLIKQKDGPQLIIVSCEASQGSEDLVLALPAVVTCDLRLNQPRPLGLAAVMKAKRMAIEHIPMSDFSLNLQPRLETLRIFEPPLRQACELFDDPKHLIDRIKKISHDKRQ